MEAIPMSTKAFAYQFWKQSVSTVGLTDLAILQYSRCYAGTSLLQADSVRFEGTAQLVALGLMHDTRSWIALRTSPSAASSTDRDNVGKEPVAERRKTQTD